MSAQPFVVRVGVYPHRVEETVAWERRALEEAGCAYAFLPSTDVLGQIETVRRADAIIAGGGFWTAEVFARLDRTRLLVSCSVGLDRVDVDAATRAGVMVCNLPEICTDEVADHTWALILACVRKVPLLNSRVHGGTWDRALLEPMPRLRGKTLGLVGFGRIARAVAERGRGFGMRLLAYDPWVDPALAEPLGAELVDLETLCRASDVLSVHTPLTPATRGLIGAAQFALLKPSVYVINTARGAVIDERALVAALDAGRVRAVGLDVLAQEPPGPDHPLYGRPNVVLTPHAAGFSDEVVELIPRTAVREVLQVLRGGTPTPSAWANRPDRVPAR